MLKNRICSGKRSLIRLPPVLSTQSASPPKTNTISINGSTVNKGSRGTFGMTLGQKSLKNRVQLPSGSLMNVSIMRYSIYFWASDIQALLMVLMMMDFLQQLQIVLRGDLQVRLNAHPSLFKMVCSTSEQLLIQFLQSSSLVVMPIGDKRSILLILDLASVGNLITKSRRRQELKEWQMKEQLLCLQKMSISQIAFRKKASIYIIASQYDSSNLLLSPIPRIYQKITFPFWSKGQISMQLMRLLPPNPWPIQQFSHFCCCLLRVGTKTVWMVQCLETGMLWTVYCTFRNPKTSLQIQSTRPSLLSSSQDFIRSYVSMYIIVI